MSFLKKLDKLLGVPEAGYGSAAMAAVVTSTLHRKQETAADVVARIHAEFNTAGDKLLADAVAVINQTDESSFSKADSLRSLGFGNAIGVKEAAQAAQHLVEKKELQQLLVDYSVKYPSYRFIDDTHVATICKKYGLVFGSATQYTGFVPAKNLEEIKAFPGVKTEDYVYQERITWDHDTEPGAWRDTHPDNSYTRGAYSAYMSVESRSSKTLLICAPAKDMMLSATQKIVGHQVVNISTYPDPVVMLPVKGGLYIILTAWGDEASDPIIQKEGLN
jgi:hypothetical protein